MKAEKLYKDGVPRFIRCYEEKRSKYADRYCVVYTHLNWVNRDYRGRVFYVSMSAEPYHPLGIGQHGEAWQWEFCPKGSRITFHDLPADCRQVVLNDYAELWG
jgi:hypothetical protein